MTRHGDRRKHSRLNVPLAVELVELESDPPYYEEATCANVSTGGIYFVTSNRGTLQVGRRLAVKISLPGSGDAAHPDGRLHWQAEVMRLAGLPSDSAGSDRVGVGMRFVNGFRLNFPIAR